MSSRRARCAASHMLCRSCCSIKRPVKISPRQVQSEYPPPRREQIPLHEARYRRRGCSVGADAIIEVCGGTSVASAQQIDEDTPMIRQLCLRGGFLDVPAQTMKIRVIPAAHLPRNQKLPTCPPEAVAQPRRLGHHRGCERLRNRGCRRAPRKCRGRRRLAASHAR